MEHVAPTCGSSCFGSLFIVDLGASVPAALSEVSLDLGNQQTQSPLPLSSQSSATTAGSSSFSSTLSTVVDTSAHPVSVADAAAAAAAAAELSGSVAEACAAAADVTGRNAEKCGNSAAMERIFLQQKSISGFNIFSGKRLSHSF